MSLTLLHTILHGSTYFPAPPNNVITFNNDFKAPKVSNPFYRELTKFNSFQDLIKLIFIGL